MPVRFIDAMARAIYAYEGDRPNQRAYRNNNPGNLRAVPGSEAETDDQGFVIRDSFLSGYLDLWNDIHGKITGNNTHGLTERSCLVDFFKVYAPLEDNNQPRQYAQFVAHWLDKTYNKQINEFMPFQQILDLIGQKVE
jgi:hypothetical protein